jgi:hypothetical protein
MVIYERRFRRGIVVAMNLLLFCRRSSIPKYIHSLERGCGFNKEDKDQSTVERTQEATQTQIIL